MYGFDPDEQDKADASNRILESVTLARAGAVSPQIIAEFFDVVTRSRRNGARLLTSENAVQVVDEILSSYDCVAFDAVASRMAARAARDFNMRIYDAMIWATALVHGIPYVLTEDQPSQSVLGGVRYVNPFAPSFELADIGL